MDLHHLKIFYISCQEKSFTKASKKLFISQSAVSIQIKKLEDSLGTQLIERNSKKFKLTYVGNELYNMSISIFDKITRMEHEIHRIIEEKTNKIIIGATHSIGEPLLPAIVTKYKKQNPAIEFDIYIKNKESLFKLLKEGKIDVLLLNTDNISGLDVYSIETDDYPFVVVAPYGKTLSDLDKMYFLRRDDENTSKYINEFEEKFNNFNIKSMYVNGSIETVKNLIKMKDGYSILPYYCIHNEIENKEMTILSKLNVETKLQIVILKENNEKLWLNEFIKFLKNYNISKKI